MATEKPKVAEPESTGIKLIVTDSSVELQIGSFNDIAVTLQLLEGVMAARLQYQKELDEHHVRVSQKVKPSSEPA